MKANKNSLEFEELRLLNQQLDRTVKQLKTSEADLRKTKVIAERFLSIAAEIVVTLDEKGKIVSLNQSGHQLLGYKIDELIGKDWIKTCIPKNESTPLKKTFSSLMRNNTDGVSKFESQIKTKSGELKTILWYAHVLKDENGNVTGIFSSGENITKRKEAEQNLKESEEKFRRITSNSADAIFISDRKGNYTYVNPKASELLGYSYNEFLKMNIADLSKPEDLNNQKKDFQKLLNKGFFVAELEIVKKDGSVLQVDLNTTLLPDGSVYASCRDITERKKVEREILQEKSKAEKNESFLRAIFENSLNAIVVSDDNGNYRAVNDSAASLFGHPREKLKKMNVSELKTTQIQGSSKRYKEYIKKGKEIGEFEFITPDGTKKIALYAAVRIRKDFNLSILADITKRKNIEKELQIAKEMAEIREQRLRKSQEAGHIGCWEYNLQTNEIWGSDEAKRIFNLDSDKEVFPAEDVMNSVVEKDREKVSRTLTQLVNENKPYDITFEIIPQNRSKRKIIRSIAELSRDENDNPLKVTGMFHDTTLQKKTEYELIKAKEKAEEADQLKSAFLTNMSHEIRTPMSGILGFTELLLNPRLSDTEQKKYIEIIQKSGNRMLDTVNDLVSISQIETGQINISLAKVQINNELKTLYEFFKSEADLKGLTLELEKILEAEFDEQITDKQKFNSIFTNFIKNAIKYTDEGNIKFGCEKREDNLYSYVSDTGIGVPIQRQDAIFNRFVQADIQDTRAFQGSGLGLAIAKAYVEMLNGTIGVDSIGGEGSKFWFTLPLVHADFTSEPRKSTPKGKGTKLQNLNILIAEDDEINANHLSIILKDVASKLLVATTGKETVELCHEHPDIDLILMDVKMPVMNGYEVTKKIRELNNSVIIIAQTAYSLEGERDKALAAGCDEYISKPIKPDLLFSLIRKVLNKN